MGWVSVPFAVSIGPIRQHLPLGYRPPFLNLGGEPDNDFWIFGGEIIVFVWISKEIEQLRALLGARVILGVAADAAVVSQQ